MQNQSSYQRQQQGWPGMQPPHGQFPYSAPWGYQWDPTRGPYNPGPEPVENATESNESPESGNGTEDFKDQANHGFTPPGNFHQNWQHYSPWQQSFPWKFDPQSYSWNNAQGFGGGDYSWPRYSQEMNQTYQSHPWTSYGPYWNQGGQFYPGQFRNFTSQSYPYQTYPYQSYPNQSWNYGNQYYPGQSWNYGGQQYPGQSWNYGGQQYPGQSWAPKNQYFPGNYWNQDPRYYPRQSWCFGSQPFSPPYSNYGTPPWWNEYYTTGCEYGYVA